MLNLVFPILSLVVFVAIIISIFAYKREEKYSFKRYFPFEASEKIDKSTKLWFVVLVAFWGTLVAVSYVQVFWGTSILLGKVTSIFYILSAILALLVFIVNLSNYKLHLLVSIFFFVTTISANILAMLTSIIGRELLVTFNLPLGIILGVLGVLLLASLFVPKLKYWMYLEKAEEDGKVLYVRPKVSILSLYEWIFLFVHVFNTVIVLVQVIINIVS